MAFVPKKEIATQASFSFSIPAEALAGVAKDAQLRLSTIDGQPLPAWLRFDAVNLRFEAISVPPQGLPLQVQISTPGRRVSVIYLVDADS